MNELAEQIKKLQNALITQFTGGTADDGEYQRLRMLITDHPLLKDIAPKFLRTCRNLRQFWHFIKYEGGTYGERRQFIWDKVVHCWNELRVGVSLHSMKAYQARSEPSM